MKNIIKNAIENATKNAIAISAIAGFVPVIGLDDDGAFLHFGWHGPKFATEEAARKAGEDYADAAGFEVVGVIKA